MKIGTSLKSTLFVSAFLGILLLTAACNKDNNSSANPGGGGHGQQPTVAQVPGFMPNPQQCVGRAAPHAGWWMEYQIQPYGSPLSGYGQPNYNPFPQNFICGCPVAYMPTCTQQGLLCVPMYHMNHRSVVTWAWAGGGFTHNYRTFHPYNRWVRPHWGVRHWHRPASPMPRRHRGHEGGRMIVSLSETAETSELAEAYGGAGNCSIDSVAQMCTLQFPGQPLHAANGMVCMPIGPGTMGVWVRQ